MYLFYSFSYSFSQFEKEEQVHSIDIGNEGSAFVEVLVANSSAPKTQDYEVFLQKIPPPPPPIFTLCYLTGCALISKTLSGSSRHIFLHVSNGKS